MHVPEVRWRPLRFAEGSARNRRVAPPVAPPGGRGPRSNRPDEPRALLRPRLCPMPSPEPGLFAELRRRNVFRVAAMYAVAAWLVVQVADATFERLGVPEAAHRILILMTALGFPVALVLGWLFDWTAEGLVRTPDDQEQTVARLRSHRRIDFANLGHALTNRRTSPCPRSRPSWASRASSKAPSSPSCSIPDMPTRSRDRSAGLSRGPNGPTQEGAAHRRTAVVLRAIPDSARIAAILERWVQRADKRCGAVREGLARAVRSPSRL